MDEIVAKLATPNAERIWFIRYAFKAGMSVEDIHRRTKIDPWFLHQILDLVHMEDRLTACPSLEAADFDLLLAAKQHGFSDRQLATIWHTTEAAVRDSRKALGIVAVFKLVDTCAAEFEAYTPYYYSTYEAPIVSDDAGVTSDESERLITHHSALITAEDEIRPFSGKPRIMILGGGPTASARASSSTTAAARPRSPCGRPGSRPSWSTRTRRRSRPITTLATISSSSR